MTTPLLLDNSAWVRLGDKALPSDRANEIADVVEICPVFCVRSG